MFSVKSAYLKLEGLVLYEDVWREEEKGVFSNLWKSLAPSKVVAFAWRAPINRIPTKANLVSRNVHGLEDLNLCILCNRMEESTTHLFLHCDVASLVWSKLMSWLNYFFPIPPNLFVHLECWSGGGRNNKIKKGFWLIWHSTIWVLWKVQNDTIFKNLNYEVDAIVDDVKVLSWRWLLSRTHVPTCLFYEWCCFGASVGMCCEDNVCGYLGGFGKDVVTPW